MSYIQRTVTWPHELAPSLTAIIDANKADEPGLHLELGVEWRMEIEFVPSTTTQPDQPRR